MKGEVKHGDSKMEPTPAAPSTKEEQKAAEQHEKAAQPKNGKK
jgi:hypothetical protein